MQTIAIDIKHTVFDNETEALMYVTRDPYGDPTQFIFAIPIISFCWSGTGVDDLKKERFNIFGDKEKQQRLIDEMKRAIDRFD